MSKIKVASEDYVNDKISDHSHSTLDIIDFPDSLPASDVSDWAKESTKPNYTYSEVGADPAGSANTALDNAKEYTDTKIAALVNGADSTMDTLGEIANAFTENKTVVEALDEAIGSRALNSELTSHTSNKSNPHSVTKSQVGLGNVPNVATNDQTPTYSDTTTFTTLTSGEKISVALAKIKLAITNLINHITNKSNPHSVTKSQVGLGNVENKSSETIRGEITKANVTTALGYTPPTTNTTYSAATTSSNGLMTSDMVTKLNGIATGANAYTHPNSGATAGTYRSVTVNDQGHVTAGSNPTITIAQGGTGATTAKAAEYNILKDMPESTVAITDNTIFVFKKTVPDSTNGVFVWKYATLIWDYIKGKISSVLGLTSTQYNGNSATATKATSINTVEASDDTYRNIFFNRANDSTMVCYDTDFQYNPATNTAKIGSVMIGNNITLSYDESTESLSFTFK